MIYKHLFGYCCELIVFPIFPSSTRQGYPTSRGLILQPQHKIAHIAGLSLPPHNLLVKLSIVNCVLTFSKECLVLSLATLLAFTQLLSYMDFSTILET